MNLFDKFLSKNYRLLKTSIIIFVLIIIFLDESFNSYVFKKDLANIISDGVLSFILTILLVNLAFYLINLKQKQLNEQIDQLTEAYQYIGQINRKIDTLLEVDISRLDHSKNNNLNESSAAIFKQLINLLQPKAGVFYLKPPLQFKIYHGEDSHPDIKKTLDNIINMNVKEFKYSHNPENEQFFKEIGVADHLLKKYTFLIKPVYMHEKDVGHMILLFHKNQKLEDRDLNIIRIYSFYLALNYTFKPELNFYQNQLE
ncbi:MAG: hypothetical protein NTZ49_03095 [Candidatus Parcubacteria bacterium]|nr:hypothetical protein [Candidatus Parcubacteria bacterium]